MLKLQSCLRFGQYASGTSRRWHSTVLPDQKLKKSYPNKENFRDLIERRQSEALRSVILEVNTIDVCGQVYNHCKQFGEIKNAFVYTLKDERNIMLLEYKHLDAVSETFKFSGFKANAVQCPNRVLVVKNSKLNSSLSTNAPLLLDNAIAPPIAHILRNAATFDEQVCLLYDNSRLTELSLRLRFLTALQAQVVINKYMNESFPNAIVYPFGSSVNGFGKMGCDIDLALRFDTDIDRTDGNSDKPLEFCGKMIESEDDSNKLQGNQVKCMASLIEYFVPGCESVSAFSGARVPIVRYFDTYIHSSVDLSVDNLAGFHITEYMYTMGLMDHRIRPFIFLVRQWAKEFGLTNKRRYSITNFQLSYMCLSFLQQLKEPLIPTFEDVKLQMNKNQSENFTINKNNEFIFDFDRFKFETKNKSTVLELFIQFLEYFGTFDFSKYMVTVKTIEKTPKPAADPLYLENVFDSTNPWGLNVSQAEISTLQIMIQESLQELEQCSLTPSDNHHNWGLLEILSKLK
ncbi:poly(A) RNA polymerase, mitochondrial-like [Contarinia nasturtii]|uniref:poly(A) RNA polymerase, mitochondrial-like n=1 Tax=Contarinia nasturtii TaxID=265458 RepID=UPI0012D413D4|nr:poly(A) RNA polymerase, mitochondrial-like [Contarinia nasturtii]